MSRDELSCKAFVEAVTEYLEGTLPRLEQLRVEEHLPECPGCSTYLEQMRQTMRIVHTLKDESVDSGSKHDLVALFRNWKNP